MKKKYLFFTFRIFCSFAFLYALFHIVPYRGLVELWPRVRLSFAACSAAAFSAGLFLGIIRWKYIMHALQIPASGRETVSAYFSGLFLNLFFPSVLAGDMFRGFGITRRHRAPRHVFSSLVMDRLSGLLALNLVVAAAYFSAYATLARAQAVSLALSAITVLNVCIVSLVVSRTFFRFLLALVGPVRRLRARVVLLHRHLYYFRRHPLFFLYTLLFSLCIQCMTAVSFYFAARALGAQADLKIFLCLAPVIMLIAFIPVTIAGAGTREAASVYFFSLFGISEPVALGIALLNFFYLVTVGLAGGVVYVAFYHRWLQSHSRRQ
ncbi:MAG: hypothetical protein GF333_05350 [Candidatus Omnitrophica bacterium]|nr:hypothetical protein [Candidatus Omnitrophota bacterium]